jgi:transcriptional regulator with XRE-family HTH domain
MSDLHYAKESGAALSAWLEAHPEEGSMSRLGHRLGINYSALRHYFAGHSFPRGEALAKLREATRLEILERIPPRRMRSVPETRIASETPSKGGSAPNRAHARRISIDERGDPRKLKLLVALRTWIGQHPELGRSGLARALGVSERTLQAWVTGRYYPDPLLQKEIARVTGVSFGPDGPALPSMTAVHAHVPAKEAGTEAQAAAEALLLVLRALEPVVQGPPARRKALREAFSREGAGYLTAALTALYSSEEDFQTWKYFAHPRAGDSR